MLKLFAISFIAVFILGFSTDVRAEVNCHRYPTISFAPTETKLYGDVEYTYIEPIKEFRVGYSNYIFKKKTAKSCHNLELTFWFSNDGEKLEKPENVGLYFTSDSTFLQYGTIAKRKFKVLNEGRIIFSRNLEYEKSHRKDLKNYSETLSTEISISTLEKIANTENLEFYLGKTKLDLTEKDINAIKQIVELVNDLE